MIFFNKIAQQYVYKSFFFDHLFKGRKKFDYCTTMEFQLKNFQKIHEYGIVFYRRKRMFRVNVVGFFSYNFFNVFSLRKARYGREILINSLTDTWVAQIYKVQVQKANFFFKVLAIKFLRRYLISLEITSFHIKLRDCVEKFIVLWNTLSKPLDEVFFHPYKNKTLVGDLAMELQFKKNKKFTNLEKQINNFFFLYYDKFFTFYQKKLNSTNKTLLQNFQLMWETFVCKFLLTCFEVIRLGYSRIFWNFLLSCTQLFLPVKSIRSNIYTSKLKSIKKRLVKRLVKKSKYRFWIF